MERPKIVVTGLGAVTPLGLNVASTWEGLITGRSGVERLDPDDEMVRNSKVQIAATVKGFDASPYFSPKELRSVHRSTAFSTVAIAEALRDSAFLGVGGSRVVGIRGGTGVGGSTYIARIEQDYQSGGDRRVSPRALDQILLEKVASTNSIKLKIMGPVAASVAACATGTQALIDAARILSCGDADVMLTVGAEAVIDYIGLAVFSQMGGLSTKNDAPSEASCPFDCQRDGFVMGEGAVTLVMEREEDALKRGAKIYAELIGYGETADAFHSFEPSGEGAARAMRIALRKAGIEPGEVDCIFAHGTSTPVGDKKELEAIVSVFKDIGRRPMVTSVKSMVGHMLGAAGTIGALAAIKAIVEDAIPPTINLQNPLTDEVDFVAGVARRVPVNIAMSNAFGVGGLNNCLLFRKYLR